MFAARFYKISILRDPEMFRMAVIFGIILGVTLVIFAVWAGWKLSKKLQTFEAKIIRTGTSHKIPYSYKPKNSWVYPYLKFLIERIGYRDKIFTVSGELSIKLHQNRFDAENLKKLAKEILIYLKIPHSVRVKNITIRKSPKTQGGQKINAGSANSGTGAIELNLLDSYTLEQIIAVVCHECTHQFLFGKNIWYSRIENENERFTDIAAVYLGFGKYLKEGYKVVNHAESIPLGYTMSFVTEQKMKLGYITADEVLDVIEEIKLYQAAVKAEV